MYQVIIVGAGPAGAYLAYLLSREGITLLLLEKERLPRYKPCAGGITFKTVRLLPFDLQPVIEDVIHTIIYTRHFAQPVMVNTDYPAVYTVRRDRFDAFLVEKAQEAGAEILEGVKVERLETADKEVTVYSGEKKWTGKIIVGADGALSTVARKLGLAQKKKRAVALQIEIPVPSQRLKQNKGILKIDYGLIPSGYAWVFPKADHLSLGVGSILPKTKRMRHLLGMLIQAEGLENPLQQIHGWTIPTNPAPDDLHHNRILLLGDAAGLADPFTGEGIYNALFSAQLAAEVIKEQIEQPRPNLEKYSTLVKQKIGAQMESAFRIARWFYPVSGMVHWFINRQPGLANDFTRLVAGEITYVNFLKNCRRHLLGIWPRTL